MNPDPSLSRFGEDLRGEANDPGRFANGSVAKALYLVGKGELLVLRRSDYAESRTPRMAALIMSFGLTAQCARGCHRHC